MPRQQDEIREINSYIKSWLVDIEISTALSYTDINKVSEGTCLRLLNLIYDYELEDLEKEMKNFPAVDLGNSSSSKIAFQITSDTTKNKIRQSLKKFKDHNLDKRFTGGIKFLLLHGSKKRRTSIEGYQDIFDMDRDILYLSDLVREIAAIYRNDQKRFFEIKEFLKFEFGNSNKENTPLIFDNEFDKVKHYLEVCKKSNALEVNNMVHFDVDRDGSHIYTEILFEESFPEKGTVITGDSGDGKSIMIRSWAMTLCDRDIVPVLLEAKYCGAGLSASIEKVALEYGFASALSFINACKALGKKILLVVDGINECGGETAERIVAELKELSAQYEILFLISVQQLTQSLKSLEAQTIKVHKPDSKLKASIAGKYSNSVNKLTPILDMVSTCMEARMVGEIGVFGVERISRYSLFELYVRRKLGGNEKDGIYLLSAIARKMSQEISFSISLRQAESIIHENKIEGDVLESCLGTKLLVKGFARISFGHEMLLNFFTAEGIARFNEDSSIVIEEFNAPKNDEKRLLILGSIEDNVLKEKILDSIEDTDLLLLLLEGEAGEYCRFWATEKLKEILVKIRQDINTIEFVIEAGSHPEVLIKKDSIPEWKHDELAFVEIIIHQMFGGELLEEVFSIVFEMDNRLDLVFTKMKDEAKEKKIGLRNGLFQSIYSSLSGKSIAVSGLSYFFSCLESGFMSIKRENKITCDVIGQLTQRSNIKTGQFYLLLLLSRYNERAHALFEIILHCVSNQWNYLPRRLKIEIVEAVRFCHNSEREKELLIEAIMLVKSKTTYEDPLLSSNLFETLADLGAFEYNIESYELGVLSEMREILAEQDNEDSWRQASYMFNAQFDHPYSSAFTNVIESLNEAELKAFYTMALKYEEEFDLFLSLLILSAEKMLGAECCPELFKILDKPILEATMSQERMKNHIVVCIIMAKYKYDFASLIETRNNEGDKLLVSLAEVFYWINRKDLDNSEIMEKYYPAVKILFDSYSPYLIDSIKVFNDGLRQVYIREYFNEDTVTIESIFADHILSACRSYLKSKDALPISKFKENSVGIYTYAVDQIGLYGNTHDLISLKAIVNDTSLGRNAVGAIKQIEARCSE